MFWSEPLRFAIVMQGNRDSLRRGREHGPLTRFELRLLPVTASESECRPAGAGLSIVAQTSQLVQSSQQREAEFELYCLGNISYVTSIFQ